MFGGSSVQIFRLRGVRVGADWTWLVVLGFLIFWLSGDFKAMLGVNHEVKAFVFATGVAFTFFLSIILHEFGHAIVARRNGIGILGIDLWMLGGMAKMDRDTDSPGVEFRVAAAGPSVTLLLAALLAAAGLLLHNTTSGGALTLGFRPGDDPWVASLLYLAWANAVLFVFNLIPAFPLDGGRIARAIAWKVTGDRHKATVIAGSMGRVFGWGLMVLGVGVMMATTSSQGIFLLIMGFFLSQSARAAVVESRVTAPMQGLKVSDVMDDQPVFMEASQTVGDALEEYFWRYGWQWFPVVDDRGKFIGVIDRKQVDAVPEEEHGTRVVGDLVSLDVEGSWQVLVDAPAVALLSSATLRQIGALMAVDHTGLLRGVVTLDKLRRLLREVLPTATA